MMQPGIPVRELHPGMGQAVAERTVLRKKSDGEFESWQDVACRVATGNAQLCPDFEDFTKEKEALQDLIGSGALMMSGRHLQHGDDRQPQRNMEVFTNCASAAASFILFQLLLNGSGVGRCYDDDMMLVDWDDSPALMVVLDEDHPDYVEGQHLSARNARHMFNGSKDMLWFEVPDSREGWAKALEMLEIAAFERVHKNKLLVLDFSGVRPKGAPIGGMQGRPSSGPVPLMNAFSKLTMIRGAGLPRWKQAMYVDHFMAECVLVGGARRAARMSTKWWRDKTVLDFIRVKRPVEFDGKTVEEIQTMRAQGLNPLGFLWSSNNSVAVDAAFWKAVEKGDPWATEVFETVTDCAYSDGTGEPGFINVDKLHQDDEGWDDLYRGDYVGSQKYQVEDNTNLYLAKLAKRARRKAYHTITNPCGEIALNILGGYCVLAATAPYNCKPDLASIVGDDIMTPRHLDLFNKAWDDRFEQSVRAAARALIRINSQMDSLYKKEVQRTNRIGVGLIGIHEWFWARWGLTFHDALDESNPKAAEAWETLDSMSRAVWDEAVQYSHKMGITPPHTATTIPPGGTISKLFGLTEGAHLPAMAHYLRWVQFRNGDPLVEDYAARGYPTRVLKQYKGHTIVGFPTEPVIAQIMPGDKLVTAAQASMADQYRWVELLERHWLEGGSERSSMKERYGNQVSYTLKYSPEEVSLRDFKEAIRHCQPVVRACTVMPQVDMVAFEYQPEEPISRERFEEIVAGIMEEAPEDMDVATMGCENGICSIEWNEDKGVIQDHGYS